MDEDWKPVIRTLGGLPTALGVALVGFGVYYYEEGLRFGDAILFWSLMWGLMFKGLGLIVMATGRRWLVLIGLAECLLSAYLVFWWERQSSLGDWSPWIYTGDALAVVLALAAFAVRRGPRVASSTIASSEPE